MRSFKQIFLLSSLMLAGLVLGSCSSGGEKPANIVDGEYTLSGNELNLSIIPPADSGATPETMNLDRKLEGDTAETGEVPEFSGVWVGTIESEDEEDEIMIWFKDDGSFIVADGEEYAWEFDQDGKLSFSDPANPSNPDVPTVPATEAQLGSGSLTLTFDDDEDTINLQLTRLVAGSSWTGLWGARTSEVPTVLVPPCGYTHMALFEDDGTVWAGEVSTEGTYDASGGDFTFELTWPESQNEIHDNALQEVVPADEYLWDSFSIGPEQEHGIATVTLSPGTVLWGNQNAVDDNGDYYGGIIYIMNGGTLIADGVIFVDAQFIYLDDGATLQIENSTINFNRWPGCRAWEESEYSFDFGISMGSDATLIIRNSTIRAEGEIPHLIGAAVNLGWFGMSNRVNIVIEGNTIITDGGGAIALPSGDVTGNTIRFTGDDTDIYGIWANKSENPLSGHEDLTISENTLIGPGNGRAIVFSYWRDIDEYPTYVQDNHFEGFQRGLSSEADPTIWPDGLKLYEKNLTISGNEFIDVEDEYYPDSDFFQEDPIEPGEPPLPD